MIKKTRDAGIPGDNPQPEGSNFPGAANSVPELNGIDSSEIRPEAPERTMNSPSEVGILSPSAPNMNSTHLGNSTGAWETLGPGPNPSPQITNDRMQTAMSHADIRNWKKP